MIKYSFLVPVFNKYNSLDKCLSTILSQTYSNFELIIVDDYSDINVHLFLEKFQKIDDRIRVYHNEKNIGIGATRNKLLELASGDYYIFVDSDDYIEPDLLENINNTLLKMGSLDIVRFQNIAEPVTKKQFEIEQIKNPYRFCCGPTADIINGETALMDWCLGTNKINTMPWTYCINTNLYNDVIYPNIKYLEDFPITHYLIAKADKVFAIDYIGYHYLQYDESLTKNMKSMQEQIKYDKEKLEVFRNVVLLTKAYIDTTNISNHNKKIFYEDIDKRYLLRKQKLNKKIELNM